MNIISLVAGDTLANLQVNLVRQDTGIAFPLPLGDTGTVHLYIRRKGSTGLNIDIPYSVNLSTLETGYLVFELGGWVSTALEGYYEGEIELTFGNGTVQTVFEQISFRVRSSIG